MADKFNLMNRADLAEYDGLLKAYVGDLLDAVDAKSLKTFSTTTNTDTITFKFYDVAEPVGSTEPKYTVTIPNKASSINYTDEQGTVGQEGYKAAVTIKGALDDLYTQIGQGGSVASQIDAAIATLDSSITAESNKVITAFNIVDGKIVANSIQKITLASVATSGAAADVSVTDAAGNFTGDDVEEVLAELADSINSVDAAAAISIDEVAGSGDVLKSYKFYQGVLGTDDAAAKEAKLVSTINIPKDYLVKSATVETVTTADVPYQGAAVGDKYVDFVINTKDGAGTGTASHLYVAINDLIHPISGSVGTEITVSVSASNEISATVNTISAGKIIYTAQVGEVGDPDYKAAETVLQALTRLDTAASTGVDGKIATAIEALDATVSIEDSGNTNPLNIQITQADGVLTGVTGSIDANTFDAYGAASGVETTLKGTSTDNKNAETIYGAKAYAKDYADGLASSYATAAQGAKADTAVQPGDIERIGSSYIQGLFSSGE